jgi:hypothetical protein
LNTNNVDPPAANNSQKTFLKEFQQLFFDSKEKERAVIDEGIQPMKRWPPRIPLPRRQSLTNQSLEAFH